MIQMSIKTLWGNRELLGDQHYVFISLSVSAVQFDEETS